MTDADARLKAFLTQEGPPAMDPRFRLAVLERTEKRQAVQKLALVVGAGAAATALTAVLAPQLSQALSPSVLLITGAMLGGAASVWGVLQIRRPI